MTLAYRARAGGSGCSRCVRTLVGRSRPRSACARPHRGHRRSARRRAVGPAVRPSVDARARLVREIVGRCRSPSVSMRRPGATATPIRPSPDEDTWDAIVAWLEAPTRFSRAHASAGSRRLRRRGAALDAHPVLDADLLTDVNPCCPPPMHSSPTTRPSPSTTRSSVARSCSWRPTSRPTPAPAGSTTVRRLQRGTDVVSWAHALTSSTRPRRRRAAARVPCRLAASEFFDHTDGQATSACSPRSCDGPAGRVRRSRPRRPLAPGHSGASGRRRLDVERPRVRGPDSPRRGTRHCRRRG